MARHRPLWRRSSSGHPPARDRLRPREKRLMVAFDLQISRSCRTLHLRTPPTGSLVLTQLSCGSNDGASSPRNHAATAASR